VSNLVRVQEYVTYNTLKPVRRKSSNTDMIELVEDKKIEEQKNNTKKKTKSCVKMFAGNCSSFSEKMREYIISKHKTFDMWALVETHDTRGQESFWNNIGFKTCLNKAQATSEHGSHGGEIVAAKTYMNTTLIKPEVWQVIKEVSPVQLRVAAMIVKIDKTEFINATAYFNVWGRV